MSESAARYGSDAEVLSALMEWREAGDTAALVTVLRTWGSSPRPPGSLLAIRRRDGRMVGSVSGGCVEADLVERYTGGEIATFPTTIDYGVDPAGLAHFGLPCGGQLELLIEEPDVETLRPALNAAETGGLVERSIRLDTGEIGLGEPEREADFSFEYPTVRKCFGPQWRLILVGAGQVADYLSRIALSLGFHVVICDPREAFQSDVTEVPRTYQMPDDFIATLPQRRRTAVVTLAHDPKVDDMALLEALRGDFFYVGAMGSTRTSAARRKRLFDLGITEAELQRLHAPVGIRIGSHTPAEIAVAIAAELVAARNAVDVEA